MDLISSNLGHQMIISVSASRIDAASALEFKEAMRKMTDGENCSILLDLSQVVFVDSSGLGAIVAVRKLLGAERSLELAGLTPDVAKVFRLTHMDRVFKIHPTKQCAVPEDCSGDG